MIIVRPFNASYAKHSEIRKEHDIMESIKDLRKICQFSRTTQYYRDPWISRNFYRKISIYLTLLLLKTKASANLVTFCGFIIGMLGISFYLSSKPTFWIIGTFIFFLFMIMDHVDGEIARYKKSSSARGRYLDDITGVILRLYILICMTIGVFNVFTNTKILYIGLVAIVSNSIFYISKTIPNQILFESKQFNNINNKVHEEKKNNFLFIIKEIGISILGFQNFGYLLILFASICDLFIPKFNIFIFSLDIRYILLIFYSLVTTVNMLMSIIQGWVELKVRADEK